MNPLVRSLFHELADVAPGERERVLRGRQIAPELRAELESLLSFDSGNHNFTEGVGSIAGDLLQSVDHHETHWGPYHRVRLLGAGGMASVYLANRTDGEIEQKVAVKLLREDRERPGWRERFLKERQLLADLNHVAIARLIDAGHTSNGRPYLVMEYVDGVPIDVYSEKLHLRDQLRLFLGVCDGVSHAHNHLIIHRDLKPSNIFVDTSGQPKLLDFGIAKLLDREKDPTQTVDRLLTVNYASPEQLRGDAETTASDVYSLGAVLYKVLTGRSPHGLDSGVRQAMDLMAGNKDMTPARQLDPNIPLDVDYILRKALRHEPGERYASVEALANDIRAFLNWQPIDARSGDTWYRTRKFVRRYRIPVVALLTLLAVLSIGLFEVNRQRAIAQRRFQQVRQLANKVIGLDRTLRQISGATNARQEIVAMSAEYLEGLGAEVYEDRELALEVGRAYLSLALVQGVPTVSNLGQYAEAEKTLSKAESLLEAALDKSRHDRTALATAAEISHSRMILADSEKRRDVALAHARKAVDRLDTLVGLGNPSKSEIELGSLIFNNVALAHKNLGLYGESVRYARRAIDTFSSIPSTQRGKANSMSILADSLRYSGDLEGSLLAIRQARSVLDSAAYPTEMLRVTSRFNVLWREALILGEDGQISLEQPEAAVGVLQEAFDSIEDLANKDPNDATARVLFQSAGRELGNILWRQAPERAMRVYDRAIKRLGEVKNNGKARRGEAQLMASSSYALGLLKRFDEAGHRIEAALKLLRETKDYPKDVIALNDETETVLRAWGDHLTDTGQLKRAAEVYEELLDKVMASRPDPTNDLRNAAPMSRIYTALGSLHLRNGRPDKAGALNQARLELWQNWNRKLPMVPYIRHQLDAASSP